MTDTDYFQKWMRSIADSLGEKIEMKMTAVFDRYLRSQLKVVYSESEAAAFLQCSKQTLQEWRKRGLISHVRFPAGRLRDGEDRLSDSVNYTLDSLLSFADRYRVNVASGDRYRIAEEVSLLGPVVEKKYPRAA